MMEGGGSGTGLAKRRGHRPPAVSTGSFPPSSSTPLAINSSTRSSAYEEAMRSAPPGIPSVLVGSPVEASWAARVGKEANVGSARTGGGGGTPTNSSNSRRQSTSAMNAAYPSVREPYPNPNPIRTTTRPGHHSHHPPLPPVSSQSMSTSHSKERHSQPAMTLNPPHSAPYAASPHSHPLSLHHSSQGPGTRLPSLNQIVHPPYNPPRPSPPQQSYHHPNHPPPPPSPTPNSASKSAFLSLFSTFFDSLQDSRVLTNTLDQQISRAGTLLQTLQQSETVLEQLVDRKMTGFMLEVERKYEGRLERLENVLMKKGVPMEERDGYVGLGIMDQSSSSRTPTSSSFPSTTSSTTEERLNKLERLLLEKEGFGEREGSGEKSLPTPHEERENGVSRVYGGGGGGGGGDGEVMMMRGVVRGVVDARDT